MEFSTDISGNFIMHNQTVVFAKIAFLNSGIDSQHPYFNQAGHLHSDNSFSLKFRLTIEQCAPDDHLKRRILLQQVHGFFPQRPLIAQESFAFLASLIRAIQSANGLSLDGKSGSLEDTIRSVECLQELDNKYFAGIVRTIIHGPTRINVLEYGITPRSPAFPPIFLSDPEGYAFDFYNRKPEEEAT